jgi:hypothetical protein
VARGVYNSQPSSRTLPVSKLAKFIVEYRRTPWGIFGNNSADTLEALAEFRIERGIEAVTHGEISSAAEE